MQHTLTTGIEIGWDQSREDRYVWNTAAADATVNLGNPMAGPRTGDRALTRTVTTTANTDPEDYDGGELLIEDTYGVHAIKLPAGHLVLYPSTSLHRVEPVTRGARLASFFWVQSMVRDEGQRTLLFDLDTSIQRLAQTQADEAARLQLTGCYHNLLRMWAQP